MPAAARGTSIKAARAFVRYYIATINYAAATGHTQQLAGLGTVRCVSCKAIVRNIDRIYSAGGSIRSDGWRVTSVSAVPLQPDREPIFDLGIVQSEQHVRKTATSDEELYPGGKQPMTIHLAHLHGGWRVRRLDLVE